MAVSNQKTLWPSKLNNLDITNKLGFDKIAFQFLHLSIHLCETVINPEYS